MPRYKDTDEILKRLPNDLPYKASVKRVLMQAPDADVVEVRHGYWYFIEYEYFCCSECGESYYNGCEYTAQAKECLRNGNHYNYCPHCGAKMDGERSKQ